jgi:hypothetical protein
LASLTCPSEAGRPKNETCTVEMVFKLIEPEALADFQRRGSASASGSLICIGEIKLRQA